MKNIIRFMLLLVTLFIFYLSEGTYSHAAEINTPVSITGQSFSVSVYEEAEEGYFIITSIFSPVNEADVSLLSATRQLTHTKEVNYYDTNHFLCWTYTLKGTFSVKIGTSAICTKVSAFVDVKKPSRYSVASESHTKSGNTCTGTISMKHNGSGSITTRKTAITCSKDGKFS